MSELTFDQALEIHNKVYPPPSQTDIKSLVIAAAFEGMHHWEHDMRLKGDPVFRDDATEKLASTAADEFERLVDAGCIGENDILGMRRRDLRSIAVRHAMHLYNTQYDMFGDMYDPAYMDANETMAGKWTGWGGDGDD